MSITCNEIMRNLFKEKYFITRIDRDLKNSLGNLEVPLIRIRRQGQYLFVYTK